VGNSQSVNCLCSRVSNPGITPISLSGCPPPCHPPKIWRSSLPTTCGASLSMQAHGCAAILCRQQPSQMDAMASDHVVSGDGARGLVSVCCLSATTCGGNSAWYHVRAAGMIKTVPLCNAVWSHVGRPLVGCRKSAQVKEWQVQVGKHCRLLQCVQAALW